MDFSEANGEWRPIPQWADFLLRFGQGWPSPPAGSRRIALVSMPCDSAAAGLVTLGAMIRDLSNQMANDIDGHYDALLYYARQYIEACSICDLPECDPLVRGCGYSEKVTGNMRSETGKIYTVSAQTHFETRQLAFIRKNVVTRPYPQFLTKWYIDGESPPVVNNTTGDLNPDIYAGLTGHAPILPDNLRRSYSGTCLAGRTAGEAPSREVCGSLRFRNTAGEHGLDELLTIHNWSALGISRITFFNSRSGQFDRSALKPSLVVADGDGAFLTVLARREFQGSDVIGVVHRVMERDRLEAVGAKMQDLAQWYEPDEDMLCSAPALPRGISISILRRAP